MIQSDSRRIMIISQAFVIELTSSLVVKTVAGLAWTSIFSNLNLRIFIGAP